MILSHAQPSEANIHYSLQSWCFDVDPGAETSFIDGDKNYTLIIKLLISEYSIMVDFAATSRAKQRGDNKDGTVSWSKKTIRKER